MTQQDWRSALGALLKDVGPLPDEAEQSSKDIEPTGQGNLTQREPLDVVVERKGRSGKTATIVCGFTIADEAVADIASKLKRRLGAGGSARGGEILIQGDRASDVLKALSDLGFKTSWKNH